MVLEDQPLYEPDDDTLLLADALKQELQLLQQTQSKAICSFSLLEMGAGSGYCGFEALKEGVDHVSFVDSNAKAINHISQQLQTGDWSADTKVSDLFDKVAGTYDIIIFNTPYLPQDEEFFDPALHGGKEGNEIAIRFLKNAKAHLAPGGMVLLLTSSISKPEKILKQAKELGYLVVKIASQHLFFEELLVYKCSVPKR